MPEQDDAIRERHLAAFLIEGLSSPSDTLSDSEAKKLISHYVDSGDLFTFNENGMKYVTATAVTQEDIEDVEDNGETNESFDLTERDIDFAESIFEQLLALQHVQQGLTFKQLIKGAGIDSEDDRAFRQTIRKLAKLDYVFINKDANPNTRSDHSKKLRLPWVLIKNQQTKEELKRNLPEILESMRNFVSA